VGSVAPDFELVKTDLSSFSLKELNGKNVILNIFPSLDTGVCATSVRKFNKLAAGLPDNGSVGNLQGFAFCTCTFLYNGGY
jgi:Peroxiredoxin